MASIVIADQEIAGLARAERRAERSAIALRFLLRAGVVLAVVAAAAAILAQQPELWADPLF